MWEESQTVKVIREKQQAGEAQMQDGKTEDQSDLSKEVLNITKLRPRAHW